MSNIVNIPFETLFIFDDEKNNKAAVVRQVGTDRHYIVAHNTGIPLRSSGAVFNVECTQVGDKTIMHKALHYGWNGIHIAASGKAIEQQYLSEMYMLLGSRDEVAQGDVFANANLMLLDGAYKYIHGETIKKKLAQKDFYYPRRQVYTCIAGDPIDVKYLTPRTLYYYPLQKTVVATFLLESPLAMPEEALPQGAQEKFRGSIIQVQRAYQGVAWKSLRNMMKSEPAVDKMVRGAIADGFIKPTRQ